MKKLYYLWMVLCAAFFVACEPPIVEPPEPEPGPDPVDTGEVYVPKTEWELADSLYTIADYAVPSHTAFKIAQKACADNPTEENLEVMRQKIKELQPKETPYCMVATINGDPATQMGFAWFTNEGVEQGEVQLVAKADATEDDFKGAVITVPAEPKTTKGIRYTGQAAYIVQKTGIKYNVKYTYVSHKALAQGLNPGTEYSWRVGFDGHWSDIAQFRTKDASQGEYSFIYMSDSHIENQEYIDNARRCALSAGATVPEAKFCVFPGDFVEDGSTVNSEWEWERWFMEALEPVVKKMAIVPTDGNHDDSDNLNYTYHFNTNNAFNEFCGPKPRPQFEGITYTFEYGDVLFLVYSMQDFWRWSYKYEDLSSIYLDNYVGPWLTQQVAEHPNTKYRVTLSHFNHFSGSDHSIDEDPPIFRHCLLPVFKNIEVDVALQGHDHTYEVIGPVNLDDCTPILSAISDREEVSIDKEKNITGYKNGTYVVDDGPLYFIGATCGRKRYYPHSRERMESDYTEDPVKLKDGNHHNVKNYFDLFTGMFGQPGAPSFTKVTVKSDCLEFNSYIAGVNGSATLINTMKIIRTKPHSVPKTNEMPARSYLFRNRK